jgi:hypothetical protein
MKGFSHISEVSGHLTIFVITEQAPMLSSPHTLLPVFIECKSVMYRAGTWVRKHIVSGMSASKPCAALLTYQMNIRYRFLAASMN